MPAVLPVLFELLAGSMARSASLVGAARGSAQRPKPCTIYRSRSTLKLRIIYSAYGGKDNKVSKLYCQAVDYR